MGVETLPTPDAASHRVPSTEFISVPRPPPPRPAPPHWSGCTKNRKFSFNSLPPSEPPVRSRSVGSPARAGPRSLAPEGFNLHTRRRAGLGPPGPAGPRPAAQPPGLGPPAAARAPSFPGLPAGGAFPPPSLRPPPLCPPPARRALLPVAAVTCSARRARAGADGHPSFLGGQ